MLSGHLLNLLLFMAQPKKKHVIKFTECHNIAYQWQKCKKLNLLGFFLVNQEVRTLVFVCYNYSHSKYNAKRKRKRNGERERDTPTPPSSYALLALNNHIFLSRFTFCVNWVFVMASLQQPHKYYKISGKITILYSLILSFASSPHTRPVKIINIHCSFEYIMCWWCDLFLSTFVSVSRLSITFFWNINDVIKRSTFCESMDRLLCVLREIHEFSSLCTTNKRRYN